MFTKIILLCLGTLVLKMYSCCTGEIECVGEQCLFVKVSIIAWNYP